MAKMGMVIHDGIGPVLDVLALSSELHAASVMEEGAIEVEQYAKTNAPWSDRTGSARAGLTASVFEEDGMIVLELAHTVDYGKWLELIQDGSLAIIMPTLEALGPEILHRASLALVPGYVQVDV